jgi:hypothetical protein
MKTAQVNVYAGRANTAWFFTMPIRFTYIASLLLLAFCKGCQLYPQISFREDVYPILEENCINCHTPPSGKGYKKSGLNMASYDSLMEGTFYGPVIVPGNSKRSILNMLVEGRADASMRMPHEEDEPLTNEQIKILHLWVSQGAKNN